MEPTFVHIVVLVWVVIVLTTGLWMIRRGHDRWWLFVAPAMGPLFVPAALARVERRPRLAASGPDVVPARRSVAPGGRRVLVGLDGHHPPVPVLVAEPAVIPQPVVTTLAGTVPAQRGADQIRTGSRSTAESSLGTSRTSS